MIGVVPDGRKVAAGKTLRAGFGVRPRQDRNKLPPNDLRPGAAPRRGSAMTDHLSPTRERLGHEPISLAPGPLTIRWSLTVSRILNRLVVLVGVWGLLLPSAVAQNGIDGKAKDI